MAIVRYDASADAVRGLFEKLAYFILLAVTAALPPLAIIHGADYLGLPFRGVTALWVFLGGALLCGIALSILKDARPAIGATFETLGRRYGYPMTLALGALGGIWWYQDDARYSDRGRAIDAAVTACLQSARCTQMANASFGREVEDSLPRRMGGLQ